MLSAELIQNVRDLSFLPNTSNFADQKVLDQINIAQRMMVVPAIQRALGEFFTETLDILAYPSDGTVRFPSAAIISSARVITWVDASGRESQPLMHKELADIPSLTGSTGAPRAFTLNPNGITVYGGDLSGFCRVRFPRLPSTLVLITNAWLSVNTVINTLGYSAEPVNPIPPAVISIPNSTYDFTESISPYRCLGSYSTVSGVVLITPSGTQLSLDLIAKFANTCYATAVGTTAVPQYPVEYHDLLIYYSAARVAGLRKDATLKQDLLGDASSIQRELLNQAQPRTKQNAKTISSWRGHTRTGGRH